MLISRLIAGTALTLALLGMGACTDQVGLAHGDPGRDAGSQTPLVGSGGTPPAAAPAAPLPDSSNATLASSNPAPLSTASPTPLGRAGAPGTGVFSSVTVTLDEHAQQLAAADPRLAAGAVATAIEHELQAQQLLAPGSGAPALAISVEDFTTTLASNATVLGYTFRNAVLIGEVTVQGAAAAARPPFEVHARVRLTSRDTASNAVPLGALYTRFAQLVVADLRGVEAPSEPIPR